MGGMDINDKLIHLNEVAIQSKSWGYLKKFNSCINICQVTGLLLYGIFSSKLYITQKHQQIVLKFIKNVASGPPFQRKDPNYTKNWPKRKSLSPTQKFG